jgi:F420-dependent oxidoreductase-like protein
MTNTFARRASSPLLLGPGTYGMRTLIDRVRMAEEAGVDQLWLGQNPDHHDTTVVAAACLAAATSMSVGTAVLPIPGRHPVMVGQAATALADLSDNRFLLGLGTGHPFINEFVLGLPPVPAVAAMREFLTILRAYLRDGRVDYVGEHHAAHASNVTGQGPEVPIYLGAMRPKMVRLAAEHADGLLLWLAPPRYVEEHVLPVVDEVCKETGRDRSAIPILVEVPVYLPDDHRNLYEDLEGMITRYAMMPAYRHVMEQSGYGGRLERGAIDRAMIDDLVIAGGPDEIAGRLDDYRAIGCVPVPVASVGSGILELASEEAFARFVKAVCVG